MQIRSLLALPALLTLALMSNPIAAQAPQHDHEPMQADEALDLKRPDSGKWASDESLRQGMNEIHAAFRSHHADYRAGHYDADKAAELATTVEEAVNFMFANCRLPAEADAELHKLLAASLGAARTLRESEEPHRGLHRLHRVLQAYPRYFDHPGWTD